MELGVTSGRVALYWRSARIDENLKVMSEELKQALFGADSKDKLKELCQEIRKTLSFWYQITGRREEQSVVAKLERNAEFGGCSAVAQAVSLCSFIDPEGIPVKVGDSSFANFAELSAFVARLKASGISRYYRWIQDNREDIERYTGCLNSADRQLAENILKDLQRELDRRKEQEDRAQREREEQSRREQAERERREQEDRARKEQQEREEQARKEQQEQEKQRRKAKKEKARREKEELDRMENKAMESLDEILNDPFASGMDKARRIFEVLGDLWRKN